jgi:hypothetical protein
LNGNDSKNSTKEAKKGLDSAAGVSIVHVPSSNGRRLTGGPQEVEAIEASFLAPRLVFAPRGKVLTEKGAVALVDVFPSREMVL